MNNNNISVTIGIPIYNVADCLEPSLLSALSQTYQNVEYILVDDCGTDNSMELAESIISKSGRKDHIRIVHHTVNMGLGEARNTVIAHTETDYLYFMDSDDILPLDAIENLVQLAIKYNHPDIVIGSHNMKSVQGGTCYVPSSDNEIFLKDKGEILHYFKNHNLIISSWNKLFSLNFIKDNNIHYIHRYHEDHYFALQEIQNARAMAITPLITYEYLLRNNSITGGLKTHKKTIDALSLVQKDIIDYIKNHRSADVIYYKSYLSLVIQSYLMAQQEGYFEKTREILLNSKANWKDIRFFYWPNTNIYKKIYYLGLLLPRKMHYSYNTTLYKMLKKLK